MIRQSRRAFLLQTSTVGMLSAVAGLAACAQQPTATALASTTATAEPTKPVATTAQAEVPTKGPAVVYVRDISGSEVTLLIGTQEFVYQDQELVARLLKAIR